MTEKPSIVLDTNVFVAAAFRPESRAGQVVDAVRDESLRMLWNQATRSETRRILEMIPPISWKSVASLFRPEDEHVGPIHPERFDSIPDPEDRKFAALAHAAGAILISADSDLLAEPHRLDLLVLTPAEFLRGSWQN